MRRLINVELDMFNHNINHVGGVVTLKHGNDQDNVCRIVQLNVIKPLRTLTEHRQK